MNAIAITPTTGKRPRLMERCRYYVERQTVKVPHYVVEIDQSIVHNMAMLCDIFERSSADLAIVFEDDDWYPRTWVDSVLKAACPNVRAIGSQRTIYYHVPTRSWWDQEHDGRASMACTAFHRDALDAMRMAIDEYQNYSNWRRWLIDLRFWNKHVDGRHKAFVDDTDRFPVGIKGLEPGHTNQHARQPDRLQWVEDPNAEHLRLLVGADADFYTSY